MYQHSVPALIPHLSKPMVFQGAALGLTCSNVVQRVERGLMAHSAGRDGTWDVEWGCCVRSGGEECFGMEVQMHTCGGGLYGMEWIGMYFLREDVIINSQSAALALL